jgi:intracellular septation protein A
MGDIDDLLKGLGVSAESFDKIKLGRGIVAKISRVAITALLALGAATLAMHDDQLRMIAIAVLAVVFFIYVGVVVYLTSKHPLTSILEGAELVAWRRMDMGVKGLAALPEAINVSQPHQIASKSMADGA